MSFGEGDLHAEIARLMTDNSRLEHERIMLRNLCADMLGELRKLDAEHGVFCMNCYEESARRLGIER